MEERQRKLFSHIFSSIKKSSFLWLFLSSFLLLSYKTQAYSQPYRVIVFDFGNVIAKTDYTNVIDFIVNTLEISNKEAEALLKKWYKSNLKKGERLQFWLNYAAYTGKTLPSNWQDQFITRCTQAVHLIPGMLELVEELKENGYQTAMLSNTTPFHAEIIGRLGYYDLFCPVLLSYQIGVSKPHRKAYEILLRTLKCPASECIFIDDKEENVQAARKLGIDSIQFFTAEELREELLNRGVCLYELSLSADVLDSLMANH